MSTTSCEQRILWGEDDENEAVLVQRAFKKAHSPCWLIRVRDGREIVAYLSGEGGYSDREKYPLPHLHLLDVNMPRQNGFEVLEWKRSRAEFKALPAVMLSSSESDCDKLQANRLGATGYLRKPSRPEEMAALVKSLTAAIQTKH